MTSLRRRHALTWFTALPSVAARLGWAQRGSRVRGQRWRLRLGAALALAYALAVLTSRDYPAQIWGWQAPVPLAESYRWFLVMTAAPPVAAASLLMSQPGWPSRRAALIGWALGLGIIAEVVSATASGAPLHGLTYYVLPHLAFWILFAALVGSPTERPVRWLSTALILAASVHSLFAIGQGLMTTLPALRSDDETVGFFVATPWGRIPRAYGLTAYPTVLGALLAVTAPLGGFALARRSWHISFLVIAATALLLSFARGSWIGAAAGWLVGSIVLRLRGSARRHAAVAALVLLLAGAAAGLQPRLLDRVAEVIPVAPSWGDRAEREQAQNIALDLWAAYPVLGVGPGNFAIAARQLPEYAPVQNRIVPAHNWLLLGLAEGGILGATTRLALWAGLPIWLLFRGRGREDAAVASSVTALAVSQWFDYEMAYWVGGALVHVLTLALWVRTGSTHVASAGGPAAGGQP